MSATEAYQVLSDPEKRKSYDGKLRSVHQATKTTQAGQASPNTSYQRTKTTTATTTTATRNTVSSDVARLSALFSTGRYRDCENLARSILTKDSRQPIPYAILGDLARRRNDFSGAAKHYATALQMDPHNKLYLDRYEAVLARSQMILDPKDRAFLLANEPKKAPIFIGLIALTIVCLGTAIVGGSAIFGPIPFISTWNLTIVLGLLFGGTILGSSLGSAQVLPPMEEVTRSSQGTSSPSVILGLIAFISLPGAAIIYLVLGLAQRALDQVTNRLFVSVAVVTFLFAITEVFIGISFVQTMLWGGNLVYIGALAGWAVSDAFKR